MYSEIKFAGYMKLMTFTCDPIGRNWNQLLMYYPVGVNLQKRFRITSKYLFYKLFKKWVVTYDGEYDNT